MKLTDERCRALTGYLCECHHEGRMPINCGYRCVKCGDTYVANRTFDNDADMMALFRRLVITGNWHSYSNKNSFWKYSYDTWEKTTKEQDYATWLFYDSERFCNLVAEWLETLI